MLFSKTILTQFFQLPPSLSADELAQTITSRCAEVEKVIVSNALLLAVKVVKVVGFKPHPEAEKLKIVQFIVSSNDNTPKEVVCGASNVRVGMYTFFAGVGTTLPNGMTLEAKKIRGVVSTGMLCSREELGITFSHPLLLSPEIDGITDLKLSEAELGLTPIDVFQMPCDTLIEIDNKSLTHRPDLWGHYGLARECCALFPLQLNSFQPYSEPTGHESHKLDESGEHRYHAFDNDLFSISDTCEVSAFLIANIENCEGAQLTIPREMQEALSLCGIRLITPWVDLSNYVMLESGHPVHFFDAGKITGKLKIGPITKETPFTLLTGETVQLCPGDLVIADDLGPLVLAGIMGGQRAQVTPATEQILIEVACYDPVKIRKTATRLNLRTEASSRFEKHLDPSFVPVVLNRTLQLISKWSPKAVVRNAFTGYVKENEPRIIDLSLDRLNRYLGTNLDSKVVKDILTHLHFDISHEHDGVFKVKVPSFRATKDITIPEDLVEEVGRIYGYQNILPTAPFYQIQPASLDPWIFFKRAVQDFWSMSAKYLEIFSYPLVGAKLFESVDMAPPQLGPVNPVSLEASLMRTSLIPQALAAVALNAKYQSSGFFFEIGKVYTSDFQESTQLLVCRFEEYESSSGGLLKLLSQMEDFITYLLGSNQGGSFVAPRPKFPSPVTAGFHHLHPHNQLDFIFQGKTTGSLFEIHPELLLRLKIRKRVTTCLVSLAPLQSAYTNIKFKAKTRSTYQPLKKHLPVRFDLTLALSGSHPQTQKILGVIQGLKGKEPRIESAKWVGTYREPSGDGFAVTVAVFFQTITDEPLTPQEITSLEREVIKTLEDESLFVKR